MYLHGDKHKITVSNVGDSRAIIGSYNEETSTGTPIATALSNDQTPWRPDERKKVVERGGRILTEDQLFGRAPITEMRDDMVLGEEIDESGQPPRVFSGNGDYPGLSVTRTIVRCVLFCLQVCWSNLRPFLCTLLVQRAAIFSQTLLLSVHIGRQSDIG